jgi:hypothetical protein
MEGMSLNVCFWRVLATGPAPAASRSPSFLRDAVRAHLHNAPLGKACCMPAEELKHVHLKQCLDPIHPFHCGRGLGKRSREIVTHAARPIARSMSTSTPVRISHLPPVFSRIYRASNSIAWTQGFFELRQYDIKPEGIKVRSEAERHTPLCMWRLISLAHASCTHAAAKHTQ